MGRKTGDSNGFIDQSRYGKIDYLADKECSKGLWSIFGIKDLRVQTEIH